MTEAINGHIRAALDAIGEVYRGGEREWLAERNPVALRQIDALEGRVDAAALAGDEEGCRKACSIWAQTWKFWIKAAK